MKKFVSILLVLVLMMSLSVAAFAEGTTDQGTTGTTPTDQETVTIKKEYKLDGAGTSPKETFTLKQVGSRVVDGDADSAPALKSITGAVFAEGAATVAGVTGDITVELPSYDRVGIYEYTLKEVDDNKTAGVTYYGNEIKLVVTVINGENGKLRVAAVHTESNIGTDAKSDKFSNTYSAGALKITKTVTGNLGDKNKEFSFTVTLNAPTTGETVRSTITVGGVETAFVSGQKYTFTLKHGQSYTFGNLPYGVTYTVEEADYTRDGYTTTKTGDTGTIGAAEQTAAFTNGKDNGSIDMGVSMDSLPYILMLVVVGAAVVVIATRKKGEQF